MINYTERLTLLMQDIVSRVPALSFIDMADVLVFARSGRSNAEGAFATCHCLTLPPSEPGYYFWRDRIDAAHHAPLGMVRHQVAGRDGRSRAHQVHDLVRAAALLRSVARSVAQGAVLSGRRAVDREARYGRARAVSHRSRARRHPPHREAKTAPTRPTATASSSSSRSPRWCTTYLATAARRPAVYDFLRHDFAALERRHGGVVGTSFRTFPSFPQRYIERVAEQPPCESDAPRRESGTAARAAAADAATPRTISTCASSRRDRVPPVDPERPVQGCVGFSSAILLAPR